MKRVISTIVAVGFISSMLVTTAQAGNRHLEVLNPLWVPAAILSTLAAAVTITLPQPVAYEPRAYPEPRQTVIYEEPRQTVIYAEPRHYRQERHYDRNCSYEEPRQYRQVRYYDRDQAYYEPRYREYR